MQLANRPNQRSTPAIRTALTLATSALLGSAAGPRATRAVEVDTSTLSYVEPGGISVLESTIAATQERSNGQILRLQLILDALTGASANGATPSDRPQTFTGPSGRQNYVARAGQTPADNTFRDTRAALSGSWMRPLDRLTHLTLGLDLSQETDYRSIGASAGISRDFAERNTTLNAGVSTSRDRIQPTGGMHVPLSPVPLPGSTGEHEDDGDDRAFVLGAQGAYEEGEDGSGGSGGSASKSVADFLLGATQVLDRSTVARVNASFGLTSGYQNDPYKILSIVQGPAGQSPGEPVSYAYEKRPDRRTRRSIFGELRRRIGSDVAESSYRYYADDWGVRSQTIDVHETHALGEFSYIKPHFRYYRQSAASFYRRMLLEGDQLPAFASADYRLGAFHATTMGAEVGHAFAGGWSLRFGVEYYLQHGDTSPPVFGSLARHDLYPGMNAWMVRVGAKVPL